MRNESNPRHAQQLARKKSTQQTSFLRQKSPVNDTTQADTILTCSRMDETNNGGNHETTLFSRLLQES